MQTVRSVKGTSWIVGHTHERIAGTNGIAAQRIVLPYRSTYYVQSRRLIGTKGPKGVMMSSVSVVRPHVRGHEP